MCSTCCENSVGRQQHDWRSAARRDERQRGGDRLTANERSRKGQAGKNTSLLASLDAEIVRKRADLAAPFAGQTAQQITNALNALLKRHTEVAIAKMEAEAAAAAQ